MKTINRLEGTIWTLNKWVNDDIEQSEGRERTWNKFKDENEYMEMKRFFDGMIQGEKDQRERFKDILHKIEEVEKAFKALRKEIKENEDQ